MQDLTPQLRTRLGRVERAVGLFILLATFLLLAGFGYYVYHTVQRKGWFVTKARYCTSLESASGLKVGDPVKLFGWDVGEITRIDTVPPEEFYKVYVEFTVRTPYFGYLWTRGSYARVTAVDFLGKRTLEVTKGDNYAPIYLVWEGRDYSPAQVKALAGPARYMFLETIRDPKTGELLASPEQWPSEEKLAKLTAAGVASVRIADRKTERESLTYVWIDRSNAYLPYHKDAKPYWLNPLESRPLTDELEGVVTNVINALPGFFSLTNQLAEVLTNASGLLVHADQMFAKSDPLLSNLTAISAALREPGGSLGQWLLPTNLHAELLTTLTNANGTLTNASAALAAAQTNLVLLVGQLQSPMQSMATIVSNLNLQVQANTNFVSEVSSLVIHLDQLIQGFKRHWFLRSAFKEKPTNPPPAKVTKPGKRP